MPSVEDAEVMPHWTEGVDYTAAFPGSAAWDEGVIAWQDGFPATDCPYDGDQDKAADWLGGWHGAERSNA
jgi:ribosome modulation factor